MSAHPRVIYAHVKNPKHWQAYHCLDTEILVEMDSAALSAAVPYSDKGIRISRQGQYST